MYLTANHHFLFLTGRTGQHNPDLHPSTSRLFFSLSFIPDPHPTINGLRHHRLRLSSSFNSSCFSLPICLVPNLPSCCSALLFHLDFHRGRLILPNSALALIPQSFARRTPGFELPTFVSGLLGKTSESTTRFCISLSIALITSRGASAATVPARSLLQSCLCLLEPRRLPFSLAPHSTTSDTFRGRDSASSRNDNRFG